MPGALRPALCAADQLSANVTAALQASRIEQAPGLIVAHVTDARGAKIKRLSLALRSKNPAALVVIVHHGGSLYCARDSRAGLDVLRFLLERGVRAVGHPYVCSATGIPADRLAAILAELRELQGGLAGTIIRTLPQAGENPPRSSVPLDLCEVQRDRLRRTIAWAAWARAELGELAREYVGRVHFRPSASGVSVVRLSPDGPQLGQRVGRDASRIRQAIEQTLKLTPGRPTPEKRLQSFLIASAGHHERCLEPLCLAAEVGQVLDVLFVMDELFLPTASSPKRGEGCDLMAMRRLQADTGIPIQIELKSARRMEEVLRELDRFAPLIDQHSDLFEELFTAVLGSTVRFAGAAERWVIWPAAGQGPDPQARAFSDRQVRLVTYREGPVGHFEFRFEN